MPRHREVQGERVPGMSVAAYVRHPEFRAGYAAAVAGWRMRDPGSTWYYEHGHQLAHAIRCRGCEPAHSTLTRQAQWLCALLDDGTLIC